MSNILEHALNLEAHGEYGKAIDAYNQLIATLVGYGSSDASLKYNMVALARHYLDKIQTLRYLSVYDDITDIDLANKNPTETNSFTPVTGNTTSFDDVIGMEKLKNQLFSAIEGPIVRPNATTYEVDGSKRNSKMVGILLYGPPGTGKSLIARAASNITVRGKTVSFYNVSGADIISKYAGESEMRVKNLFEAARSTKPSVIFVDEIENLVTQRGEKNDSNSGILTQFLVEMDGYADNSGIVFIAATNVAQSIDAAFKRRLQYKIYMRLPTPGERRQIIEGLLKKYTDKYKEKDLDFFVESTDHFSPADISSAIGAAVQENANNFRTVNTFEKLGVPDKNNPEMLDFRYRPSRDKNTVTLTPQEIEDISDKIYAPRLDLQLLNEVFLRTKPTSTPYDIKTKYYEI